MADNGTAQAKKGAKGTKKKKSDGAPKPGSKKGPMCNGFATIQEADCIQCRDSLISPHTLPAEVLTFDPPAEAVISSFKNGDKERKIHCNIELTDAELDQIKGLQQEAKQEDAAFYPSITSMATRFLSRARGDPKKGLKLMQATQEWREEYFKDGPITGDACMENFKHGIVYFSGRDKGLRPALIVRANRIPAQWYKEKCIDKFIALLIFCMEYFMRYMVIPGRVENLCLIVDLKGLGVSQVPLGALGEVYNITSHHYLGRAFRFYVCNLSGALGMIAGMAKGLLTDRQKQKLVFINDVTQFREDFALHALEEDLGGTRPVVKEYFPFPIEPGPHNAGCSTGPTKNVQEGCHALLSAAGAQGRLWDRTKTREENLRLDYAPGAADILRRCGLPVPKELEPPPPPPPPPAPPPQPEASPAAVQEDSGNNCIACDGHGCGICKNKGRPDCIACGGHGCSMCKGKPAPATPSATSKTQLSSVASTEASTNGEVAEASPQVSAKAADKVEAPFVENDNIQEEEAEESDWSEEKDEPEEQVIMQGDAVKTSGFFGCSPCWCTK